MHEAAKQNMTMHSTCRLLHEEKSETVKRPIIATETREELYYNKQKLLDNGDRWESVLAKNIKLDKPYR